MFLKLLNQYRTLIEKAAYWLLPVFLLVMSMMFSSLWFYKKLGTIAFYLLTLNLFLKPISILWPIEGWSKKWLQEGMTFRREMGVATFWFYLFHATGMIRLYAFNPLTDFSGFNNFLFWGAVAGMGLWVMVLTSNDKAVTLLRRNWKRLHRIVYLVYYAVLIHNVLGSAELIRSVFLGFSYAALKVGQYMKMGRI